MRRGFDVHPFSESLISDWLGDSKGVLYLIDYLMELGATAILLEQHYVDRHFVDDFATYYARSFNAPEPYCRRVHFFAGVSEPELRAQIDSVYHRPPDRKKVEQDLTAHYLGFVVWRPLDGAVLGRTVLRTYDSDNNRRKYPAIRDYHVNIAGVRLGVQGLAYQQQDRGAAVCASTALWSALQQVAHLDGQRTPTPSAITRAANSPLPANYGLSMNQMATALSSLGYGADLFFTNEGRSLFRAKVVACLLSRLPVVLWLGGSDNNAEDHAVTITGYSELRLVSDVSVAKPLPPLRMKAGSLEVVYVHDDNLGSHAHYELFDADVPQPDGSIKERLMIRRGRTDRPTPPWRNIDERPIIAALVPKPGKLRLPVSSLLLNLLVMRRPLEVALPGLDLHFDARFDTGVRYRESLFNMTLYSDELRDFQANLSMPRHIGVISAFSGERHITDLVLDVSEVTRHQVRPSVLAMVCPGVQYLSPAHANLVQLSNKIKCQLITGSS